VEDGENLVWQISINGCAETPGCECPVTNGQPANEYYLGYEVIFECQTAPV
jgi:hypothetical protein